MNRSNRRWIFTSATVLAVSCTAGPGQKTDTAKPEAEVLTEFSGHWDAEAGQLTFELAGSTSRGLDPLNTVQDGVAGSGPAESVELVTESTGDDMAGCGFASSFCGNVRLRSFYAASSFENVYVEIISMVPVTGNEALNSDAAVPDVSDALGLFAYADLGIAGAPDDNDMQLWVFPDNGMDFSFRGRVMADMITGVQPSALGDLLITEIMQNPNAEGDTNGEWFEVFNDTGVNLDLNGCVISDNGTDSHTIAQSVVVQAGTFAVLARSSAPGFGFAPDYDYSSFLLTNGDDEVVITCGGTEIDRVEYDGGPDFPDPDGASMALNGNRNNTDANDRGSNWCESTTDQGNTDLATPGAGNDPCPTEFDFPLEGSQEVPDSTSPHTGNCTGTLSADTATFTMNCTHDIDDPTAAHIHDESRGNNGPVLVDLGDPTSPIDLVHATDAGFVADLLGGGLYVNVHSTTVPTGDLRGQIEE